MPQNHSPEFQAKLSQMRLPLAPLVQLTTGLAHPEFPRTLLHYWLLTESTLDSFAHFYHQATPCRWTYQYPKSMNWREGLTIEEKRRKLGNFIGLRGCESPVQTRFEFDFGFEMEDGDVQCAVDECLRVKTEEQIWEEARRAREGAEDEVMIWRRKMGRF